MQIGGTHGSDSQAFGEAVEERRRAVEGAEAAEMGRNPEKMRRNSERSSGPAQIYLGEVRLKGEQRRWYGRTTWRSKWRQS